MERSPDTSTLPLSFGELLKRHRLAAGLSQEALADRARVSVKTISALEQGARQRPYRHTIASLSDALGLSHAARIELEGTAARVPAARSPLESLPNNLPAQLSSFVGREHDAAALEELIATNRLVTLVGTGGIGKTRLALHVAADAIGGSTEGVWFVDFAPLTDGTLVPSTIANALGVHGLPNRPVLEALCTYLKHKRILLVLDNCEHVIDDVAKTVDAMLKDSPNVRILATSREALRVGGERTYRVPSLDVPPSEVLESLDAERALGYSAVALFADRAKAADHRFTLTSNLVPTVAEVCRQLDGIALAIELAAARVNVLSPMTLKHSLRDRFLVLTGGNRTALPRHKTMCALIDWSYDLLNPAEQQFFRRVSIFCDGFTSELLLALFEHNGAIAKQEVFELLASLCDKSLLQTEAITGETERYRLLDVTRQYALEKLNEHGERDTVARAYALALLDLARRFDSATDLKPDRLWRNLTAVGIGDWRAALEWALETNGDVRIGQEIAASRGVSWFLQSPSEGRRWVQKALATVTDDTPLIIRGKLELSAARLATDLSELESTAALEAAESALQFFQKAGDEVGVADAQSYLGLSLVFRRRIAEGKDLLARALETAQKYGAQLIIGTSTHALAIAYAVEGDYATSRRLFREALGIFKSAECDRIAAQITADLAEAEYLAGNIDEAVQLSHEAGRVLRANRNWVTLANVLSNCSAYQVALKRFDEAQAEAREALRLARDAGMTVCTADILQRLAAIASFRGTNLQTAARVLGFVDARLRELQHTRQDLVHQEYEKMLQALRQGLGSELEDLMEEGRHWYEDRAVAEALSL